MAYDQQLCFWNTSIEHFLTTDYFENNITTKDFIQKGLNSDALSQFSYNLGETSGTINQNNVIDWDLTSSNILIEFASSQIKSD